MDQIIIENSGSGGETLWDLRLIAESSSIASRGKFQFRLNNSITGSLAIASNAVSMSTDYLKMGSGELWNVMLQRMTASISGSGTQEYRLLTSFQDRYRIKIFNAIF